MAHASDMAMGGRVNRARGEREAEPERLSGSEWDSESSERVDDRDAENMDLDIECINDALERRHV